MSVGTADTDGTFQGMNAVIVFVRQMKSSRPRNLMPEECWRITCHEAGHAIVAVRHGIPLVHVERGEGEHGEVELATNPIDDSDDSVTDFDPITLRHYQEVYAAGAAAERLLFGRTREYALEQDRHCHGILEERLNCRLSNGFEEDTQSAMKILDRSSIENVAEKLDVARKLTMEDVAQIIGHRLSWQ